ncbi:TonB-dependent receptor [Membranihabitans marinus]|uniref:TonB-dependent receptor n=1 Tax=Membranihabitans marinus TaxID=1227546 RepID=UPI001F17BC08|nr:TonB-dependent receptor [Membranihabitans marinus]
MKRLLFHLSMVGAILFLSRQTTIAQTATVSGYIEETGSGEKIIGANILEMNSLKGTVSNIYGFYSLSLPVGQQRLIFSYVGYQSDTIVLNVSRDTSINLRMSDAVQLAALEVKADRARRIEEESQMSKNDIPVDQIKKLPAFLGETDVLKTLQLLPGVQSGSEGTSGIFVRGGSIDQNLILVDGVPIYNPTHVLGIFSSFNADAIKSVSITKGGFPARYGGRLSSVVEVNTKDGHMNEYHGAGQIGLMSSKLLVEGPIVPEKSSFVISGRRSYIDVIARPIAKISQKGLDEKVLPTAFFYDFNGKLNYRFNEDHRLILSTYLGSDKYGINYQFNRADASYQEDTNAAIKWGNFVGSLNWNHKWNPRTFANTTLTYSKYQLDNNIEYNYKDETGSEEFHSLYFSGITDFGLKYSVDYLPNSIHSIKAGSNWTHHTYEPGALTYELNYDDENEISDFPQDSEKSIEAAYFIEDDINWGRLRMNIGLHYSQFFTNDQFYHSLQPRWSMSYLLPDRWAVKASYASMAQYVNLLSNEALSLPTDLWVPSTENIVPQKSWQVALGVAKTVWNDYEFSIEGYYKEMDNVLSYRPGVSFILGADTDWEDKITQGRGNSYGLEMLFQKKFGKTTGWIAYTLSWNNRQFDEINRGRWYPYKFDRRHDISVVLSHEISKKWSMSTAWIYGTGNAYSVPEASYRFPNRYYFGSYTYSFYNAKNNYRMSDYHRLDISFKREKVKKRMTTSWTFGAYNTYFRKNPFFIQQDFDGKLKEITILPIIPYFTWGFKF